LPRRSKFEKDVDQFRSDILKLFKAFPPKRSTTNMTKKKQKIVTLEDLNRRQFKNKLLADRILSVILQLSNIETH